MKHTKFVSILKTGFKLLIANFAIVFFILSTTQAVTHISPGDRMFMQGNQWASNLTAAQTECDVIVLSSYKDVNDMKYITNTLSRKLMIRIAAGGANDLGPPAELWPDSARVAHHLSLFRTKIKNWLGPEGIDISAFHFNLEFPYYHHLGRHSDTNFLIQALADTMTMVVKDYQRTIQEVCIELEIEDYPELWVYSSKAAGLNSFEENGCDWNALTTGEFAIDIPTINVGIEVPYQLRLDQIKTHQAGYINEVKGLTNGKPVVVQFHSTPDIRFRDELQYHWHDVRDLTRHVIAASESGSSHYGGNYPVAYWGSIYRAVIPGTTDTLEFTQDVSGAAPTGPFPWPDGLTYPARIWENGHEGDWGYNKALPDSNYHNKWEREILANFLTATGTPLPGHTLPASTTWRDDIYLIGDLIIPSGVTLTIEPGTRIFFRPDEDVYEAGLENQKAEIIINTGGALIADATGGDPITFESSFNVDPDSSAIASSDDWAGIRNTGGTLTLKNCQIKNAKVGVEVISYAGKTTLQETDLSQNHKALKVHEGASTNQLELTNIGLYRNQEGIIASMYGTGHVKITNATIADNQQGVAFLSDDVNPTLQLKNTAVAYNDWGIHVVDAPAAVNTLILQYCDVYGSTYGDFYGKYTAMPTGGDHIGNLSEDPLFVNFTANLTIVPMP